MKIGTIANLLSAEVLCGALYACVTCHGDFDAAMITAVNHSGRSAAVGAVTGMVMVFSVLGLLAVIVTLSKVIFYDIPNQKSEQAKKEKAPAAVVETAPADVAQVAPAASEQNDAELVAVITAAIAAMIESGDYKNEFAGGFRVVSFKRTTQSAWNRK